MMGWNEITGDKLHEYQSDADTEGVKQELASGTIVHFWKGDTALIRKTIEKGYDVVNSYHEYTYLDYSYESIPMEKAYSFNPVPEGLTDDQKSKVLGLGCQMWGEFIPTVESMNLKVYPRLALMRKQVDGCFQQGLSTFFGQIEFLSTKVENGRNYLWSGSIGNHC